MSFLFYYIAYITPASIIIPICVGLLKYKHLTYPFKVLFWFLLLSALSNVLNIILLAHYIKTTKLFHIYTIFEFAFISLIYNLIFNNHWWKIIAVIVAVFTVLCILNFFFIQNGTEVDTYTGSLEAVIIIAYSILYLFKQSNIENAHSWADNGFNWINIAFLMYYGCGLFMFISTNYIMKASLSVNFIIWSVFDTILVVESILFAIGLYKCNTQTISTY